MEELDRDGKAGYAYAVITVIMTRGRTDGAKGRLYLDNHRTINGCRRQGKMPCFSPKVYCLGVRELSYLAGIEWAELLLALAAQTSHSTSIRIGINMGKRGTR